MTARTSRREAKAIAYCLSSCSEILIAKYLKENDLNLVVFHRVIDFDIKDQAMPN